MEDMPDDEDQDNDDADEASPLTQRYIHQLLFGCSRSICDNPFCANNPNFSLTGTPEVMQVAHTLARMGTQSLCDRDGESGDDDDRMELDMDPEVSRVAASMEESGGGAANQGHTMVTPLQLDSLEKLLTEARTTNAYGGVMRQLYGNFSSSTRLATCFRASGTITTNSISPLSMMEVNQAYALLVQCPHSLMNCVVTAISCLIDKIKMGQEMVKESNLDALLILLR